MDFSLFHRRILAALIVLSMLFLFSTTVSAGDKCKDPCILTAGCQGSHPEAPYNCDGRCVPKGFDYGDCGGMIEPYGGYCEECDQGCPRADGPGQPCEGRDFAPFICQEDWAIDRCRPRGYDHGCCGDAQGHFANGNGVCEGCDLGCPHVNETVFYWMGNNFNCSEEAPYKCFDDSYAILQGIGMTGVCQPFGYDNGCCGGITCVEHDSDNDCVPDEIDNCPSIKNNNQSDLDSDCKGDVCDKDMDNDGVSNEDEGDQNGDGQYEFAKDVDNDGIIEYGDYEEDGTIDEEKASSTHMATCDTDGNGIPDGIDRAFEGVYGLMLALMGFIASFFIVYDGLKYVSADSPKERASAKASLLYILLGLVIFLIAQPLVGYLLATTSTTCEVGLATTCQISDKTEIIYPLEDDNFVLGREVTFAAATEFGKDPASYEWLAYWICDADVSDCQSSLSWVKIGNSSYFTNNTLQPAKHLVNLTVAYQQGGIGRDSVVFGVSPP
ncbi:MAG: thrombospondin type 3 repeat-containing protein [Candidatus Altiarchaeota archaeon]